MKDATKPLIGVISSNNIVKSQTIEEQDLKKMCHHKFFPLDRNRRWRYSPKEHEVKWTDDFEDDDALLVNEHLYKINLEDPTHC